MWKGWRKWKWKLNWSGQKVFFSIPFFISTIYKMEVNRVNVSRMKNREEGCIKNQFAWWNVMYTHTHPICISTLFLIPGNLQASPAINLFLLLSCRYLKTLHRSSSVIWMVEKEYQNVWEGHRNVSCVSTLSLYPKYQSCPPQRCRKMCVFKE